MKAGIFSYMTLVLVTVFLASAVAGEEIKIGAGQAPTKNILEPIKTHFEKASGISLSIVPSGPKVALQELEKGTVEVPWEGSSSRTGLPTSKKRGAKSKIPVPCSISRSARTG
jgi:phosphate transport system substrate-binding protein